MDAVEENHNLSKDEPTVASRLRESMNVIFTKNDRILSTMGPSLNIKALALGGMSRNF